MGPCLSRDDAATSKISYILQTLEDHDAGINCMALSEDSSILVTGSEDRTARLWSTKSLQCECIGILKGHDDYVNCVLCTGCYVVTGSADKTIRKWEMATCDCIHVFRGHASIINRMISTGEFIFSSSYDKSVRCWDLESGECIRVFSGHKKGVYPMVFVPGPEIAAVNVPSVTQSKVSGLKAEDEEGGGALGLGFDWETGNKDILLTGAADTSVRSWSFETGKCIKIFKGHTGAITCMSANSKGKTLYSGSTDQMVISWNISTAQIVHRFEGHTQAITCMALDGKILYTGSSDMTAKAWISEFGDCTRTFKGHKHTVSAIKFYKGLIFTTSGDGFARCFDSKTGLLKRQFTGHSYAVNTAQIVDGKLFTGSHDAKLIVWDVTGINRDAAFGLSNDTNERPKEKLKPEANVEKNMQEVAVKKPPQQIMIGDEDELDDDADDDLDPEVDARMSAFTGNIRQVRVRP